MLTRCPYCWYAKPDSPLDETLLRRLTETDLPIEDYMLLIKQQVEKFDLKDYHGVQIHIGRMHKGRPTAPVHELAPSEAAIINGTDKIKGLIWL